MSCYKISETTQTSLACKYKRKTLNLPGTGFSKDG